MTILIIGETLFKSLALGVTMLLRMFNQDTLHLLLYNDPVHSSV